jgi:ABC-type cobalamin/Fe3+-siderophores transport system ATPase subunit
MRGKPRLPQTLKHIKGPIQKTGNPKEVIPAEFLKDIYQIEAKVRLEDNNYVNIMPLRKL